MQFRLISGFLVFVGSYFPLAIILAIQDIPQSWWKQRLCDRTSFTAGKCSFMPLDHPVLALTFIAMTIFAISTTKLSLRTVSYRLSIDVKSAKAIPNELINYTFPYVVSFMGIAYSDSQKLLGFIVFLFWMFAITYKSGQILMNPLLIIFGWRLHEATITINGVERETRIMKQGILTPGKQQADTIQDFYIVRD